MHSPSAFAILSQYGKQPRFEVVEGDVGVKAALIADPFAHLPFGVIRRFELTRGGTCINVRQSNDRNRRI